MRWGLYPGRIPRSAGVTLGEGGGVLHRGACSRDRPRRAKSPREDERHRHGEFGFSGPAETLDALHPGLLFFGRPSGENEEIDLRLCKEGSGPRGDRTPKTKNNPQTSSSVGSEDGSSDSSFSTRKPSSAAALKHLTWAGESMSRAKVRKRAAKTGVAASDESENKETERLVKQQYDLSKGVAEAVQQMAADIRIQRELDVEHACRKRKQGAISDQRVELEFAEPKRARVLKAMIGKIARMDVADFTSNITVSKMGMDAPSES